MDTRFVKIAANAGIRFPTILPLFRSPPRKEEAGRWIAHHSQAPLLQSVAKKIVDNINYISFESFLAKLQEMIGEFNEAVNEPYVLWISQERDKRKDIGCSELWVSGLAFEYCGLRAPQAIVWTNELNDYLAEHPEIKRVLILDDASYSGRHITDQLATTVVSEQAHLPQAKINSQLNITLRKNRCLYIGIPFLSSIAENQIFEQESKYFASKCVLVQENFNSIQDFLSEEEIGFLKRKHSSMVFRSTLTYFDHRFPDIFSTYDGLSIGNHLLGSAWQDTDELKDEIEKLNSTPIQLVPSVVPPYQIEYSGGQALLAHVLERGSHGEWARNPVPERFSKGIEILTSKGIDVVRSSSLVDANFPSIRTNNFHLFKVADSGIGGDGARAENTEQNVI